MKQKEIDKCGMYIFIINLILTLFLLSSDGEFLFLWITTIVSNIIALIFNTYVIKISKKSLHNALFLIVNIIFANAVIFYGYFTI